MARPKQLRGINKVCSQCLGLCKQSSDMEIEKCPLFRATPHDPSKLVKPLRLDRSKGLLIGKAHRSGG